MSFFKGFPFMLLCLVAILLVIWLFHLLRKGIRRARAWVEREHAAEMERKARRNA